MTQTTLPPPALLEAENGVLKVSSLDKVANGRVDGYDEARTGDAITLEVNTSTGNAWEYRLTLTTEPTWPLVLAIPKDVFAKSLVPKATAELFYTVAGTDQVIRTSAKLTVHLIP
ncbi:hypothetical protein [Pseudomonas hamedanensis]|uniref:Uncharacterized protein n=1 Tax=Pseudomonas hamedanensis TaxID=2745504 RepID=A0A9E6NVX4_9PSED|nr:hypothetical protein [Pseudomonas hamedanensis]QXI14926.1 hypothetical protein HU739_013365 [Pseudomonas hamedanensis]